MIKTIKDYIKTKPRLYDAINSLRPMQSNVERWLNKFSRENNKNVNFIQIGANDGLRWDPFRRFIVRDGWSGILVEPLPPVFGMLKNNYAYLKNQKLVFVNAAIALNNEEFIEIWSCSEKFCNSLPLEERMFYLRKSSLNREHVEAALKNLDDLTDKVVPFRVKCMTVNALIKEYWSDREIDLVLIDAEGYDDKIIRSIDFEAIQPKAILFESHNLGSRRQDINDFLSAKGYTVTNLGGDSVAVRHGYNSRNVSG